MLSGKIRLLWRFPKLLFQDGSESLERVFGTCNGVDHRGSGGNDVAWLIVAIVSSWVSM